MNDFHSKIAEIYSLEQLSSQRSYVHDLHPLVKICSTLVYILCVLSFDRYTFLGMLPYVLYPLILIILAKIPLNMICKRTLIALPFCLFAAVSNVFLDRATAVQIGWLAVSFGVLSLFVIMLRTLLCVAAVLILVAVTPLRELTDELRRMHLPNIFIILLEMTYRYIGILLEEASTMFTAYRLRSRRGKGVEMKHMGSFVGQLLLRSFDRAERVYQAMKCRGYALHDFNHIRNPLTRSDWFFLLVTCGFFIFLRWYASPYNSGRLF